MKELDFIKAAAFYYASLPHGRINDAVYKSKIIELKAIKKK